MITPEYISKLINFNSNSLEPNWAYDESASDMRNLQVKGAARVYNLLEEHKLALLADEVGMGKTIQALAVCAALWNEKPDARIMILAPRDEIAKNWEKEYQTFIRHHYRNNDDVVKSISGQEPVKRMNYCQNLYSLVHEIQQGWGQLFIGKISSFSSLMAKRDVIKWLHDLGIMNTNSLEKLIEVFDREKGKVDKKSKNKSEINKLTHQINSAIIKELKKVVNGLSDKNKPYFDLLIIDEAHYFRKNDGGSLKVESATEFFGNPHSDNYRALAKKVLLLTATPNHSSSKDIGNIVSYFSRKYSNEDHNYKSILEQICVRRLRRLSKNGYNKYNYRQEIPSPSDFKENPLSEMFFGLYQHELAKELNKKPTERSGGKGGSKMMKYLEGVEFIPFKKKELKETKCEDEPKGNQTDYKKGKDYEMLITISNKFYEIFNEDPHHPKYGKLEEDLTKNNLNEKAVIFVRRIPSVYEIAKRIIAIYDKTMWHTLKQTGLNTLEYEDLNRRTFFNITTAQSSNSDSNDSHEDGDDENNDGNIPFSKVMDLFKIIKSDPKYTHASSFRLRFNHSKPSIFSMFFCPGEDYYSKPYEGLVSYRYEVGSVQLENYFSSSLIHRTNRINDDGLAKDILSVLLPKNPLPNSGDIRNIKIETLITIFWEVYLSDDTVSEISKSNVIGAYKSFNIYEKEAFSSFIEKGTILASEGLVWFYKIFRKLEENQVDKPIELYQKFTQAVKSVLISSKLYSQIQESILHFRQIYTKVFSINGDRSLIEETWDSFNNAQPIYPYSADNSNHKVLRSFNTPFYPDILVATSVLQEGVNLQYFCNTVYHYGMAWTPGDNEQRIGRIDRMFGKIERMLEKDSKSRLGIFYPYLKDTIDEEQLRRFAKRKYKEEALIDMGKAFEEESDFAVEENDNDSWKQFLREPVENSLQDPYPAENFHFEGIKQPIIFEKKNSLSMYYSSIINAIKEIKTYNSNIYYIDKKESLRLLIDPTLGSDRKQPVIIELNLDSIGSGFMGESIYCLKMKTPLAPYSKFKKLRSNFIKSKTIQELYLPGIKLCLDPSQAGGTNWGLYMVNELPLFISDLQINPLSVEEIQNAFINLIECADRTEKDLFENDLKKEELNLPVKKNSNDDQFRFRNSVEQKIPEGWLSIGNHYVKEFDVDTTFYNEDIEKQSLINNHNNSYVKTFLNNGKWKFQVGILKRDAQNIELQLLEKHLDVVNNGLGW